jgi:PIN domain nuclease of toxin-antitoxin system
MEPKRLSKPAAQAIRRARKVGGPAVASITLFEAAWLFERGRVLMPGTVTQALRELLDATHVQVLDVSVDIAVTAAQFSDRVPGDPTDRLIAATALVHAIPLVTKDSRIRDSGVCRVIW